MARLADTLTESGHNVTFFTPIIDETRKNQLGVKLTKNVIKLEQDSKMKEKDVKIDDMMSIFWTMDVTSKNGHRILETLHQQAVLTCDNLFRSKEIIEKLRENQYDIGLAEPLMTCGLALFRHLNIEKTIITSSCVNYDILLPTLGEPVDTSYWPTMNSQVTEKMDFSDRLENFEMLNLMLKTFGSMFDDEAKTYRSHLGPNFPDWKTLIPEASLHFVNSIPFIDFPRPHLQKTIAIGGISVDFESVQSLESSGNLEFSKILEKRPKNMLISFGTLAKSSTMPENFKKNLLEVFKSQPNCTFIWKYESDDVEFAEGVENLEFVKWAPQMELLKDSRMTAFLTHGGLGSTNEAAFFGIPTIMVIIVKPVLEGPILLLFQGTSGGPFYYRGPSNTGFTIPIFADQSRNANMLARHGMSIVLHKKDLGNFEKLREAFSETLNNENYRKNAEKIAEIVKNQPIKPKDLVVKFVEFVGKFGPFPQMSPHSLKMSDFQRYNYDIYIYKFLVFIFPIFVILVIFRFFKSYFSVKIVPKIK